MGKILASSFAFCQFLHVNFIWRWKYRTFSFMEWSLSYLSHPHSESRKTLEPTNATASFILIYPHGLIFALWYIFNECQFWENNNNLLKSFPNALLHLMHRIVANQNSKCYKQSPTSLPASVIFTELFLSWAFPGVPCSPISRSYQ